MLKNNHRLQAQVTKNMMTALTEMEQSGECGFCRKGKPAKNITVKVTTQCNGMYKEQLEQDKGSGDRLSNLYKSHS